MNGINLKEEKCPCHTIVSFQWAAATAAQNTSPNKIRAHGEGPVRAPSILFDVVYWCELLLVF